jgi:hypothetical protein
MPYAKPTSQMSIFEEQQGWEAEWQDMPEFVQQNLLPEKSIKVNFASIEDMKKFADLIGQIITIDTQYVWFPKAEIQMLKNKLYVDEE